MTDDEQVRRERHVGLAAAVGLVGFGIATAAETWTAVVLTVLLPLVAALIVFNLGRRQPNRFQVIGAWVQVVALLGTALVIGVGPKLLVTTSLCPPTNGRGVLDTCLRAQASGEGEWKTTAETTPGSIVFMKGRIKALKVQSDDVVLRLGESKGVSWVDESLRISNSKTDDTWSSVEGSLEGNGINIGSYAPGGAAYVSFAVRISGPSVFECGRTTATLPLIATSTTEDGRSAIRSDVQIAITTSCS